MVQSANVERKKNLEHLSTLTTKVHVGPSDVSKKDRLATQRLVHQQHSNLNKQNEHEHDKIKRITTKLNLL